MTNVRGGVLPLSIPGLFGFAPSVQAQCPPPPPLGAPENPAYARPGTLQQAASENGGRRTMTAVRIADGESIDVDGRLDEAAWARAIPAGDFMQIEPDNYFGVSSETLTDLDNSLLERSITLSLFNVQFHSSGFYSGTRNQTVVSLNVRARPGCFLYLNSEWNRVDLAEGSFATNVYRVIGEAQFSPFVTLVNNVQYDTQSAVLGWQSRFRWTFSPGKDLYVVYNHNWLDDPLLDRFSTLDKRLASKILYTYRF